MLITLIVTAAQRPKAIQLLPPQRLTVTRSAGDILIEWQPPFYAEYFVKGESVASYWHS